MSDTDAEDYPPFLEWATDPSGRRYWVTGGPTFGFNPLVSLIKGFLRSRSPAKTQVGGRVTVTRVEGDLETEVFEKFCNTFEEGRALAESLVEHIQSGTFQEQPPRDQ